MFRLLQIFWEGTRFGGTWLIERLGPARSDQRSPTCLRQALARLGPTFIKLGQGLSLRQDMLPGAYITALQSLQDHIAPFPGTEAIAEIERGLGHPVEELFAAFDVTPLASASIAQVHAARLHDGREVIVKVRRTSIQHDIERDMRALARLARAAAALAPHLRRYQLSKIIAEIRDNLRKEIDFRKEARNIRQFAQAFRDWPSVYVPDVIDEFVCETVIVQVRSHGARIDDPAIQSEGPRLAQAFVDLYLHQFFVLGVFHGDPHPGNLFVTSDGRICFHDFGLVGSLDRSTQRKLAIFTTAFIRQDADWLLDAAIDLGVLGGTMDRAELRHGLLEILTDYAGRPIKEWSLAEAFVRVTRLGRGQDAFVPYDLIVLMRTMFLIEHAVQTLDPDFQLLETLLAKGPEVMKVAIEQPIQGGALDRLKLDAATALHDLPVVLGSWVKRLQQDGLGLDFGLHLRGLEGIESRMARSTNRLTLALVTLGLYIAASLLMQHSIGPRLYGMPILAALAYGLALWFTFRLTHGIGKSGGL